MSACNVSGCLKPVAHRGLCHAHYRRLLIHGSPTGGGQDRATRKQTLAALDAAINYKGEDCFFWPHARNSAGYGHMTIDGKHRLVHRLVCEAVHGESESDGELALHSCGNGHLGCVNPGHLRWGSHSDNRSDEVRHQRSKAVPFKTAKLSISDVRMIRNSNGPQSKIAAEFGVTQTNVSAIKRRKSWGWVS